VAKCHPHATCRSRRRRSGWCRAYRATLRRGRRSLAASQHLHGTLEAVRPILERYLASRGRTFAGEVQRKRARLMSVTAFLNGMARMRRRTGHPTSAGGMAPAGGNDLPESRDPWFA
jgi:hypothetical protein